MVAIMTTLKYSFLSDHRHRRVKKLPIFVLIPCARGKPMGGFYMCFILVKGNG